MEKITIPKSVKKVGGLAFAGTKWLENKQKERKDSLVIINGILIDGSKSTGNVKVPKSVKIIGESAFFYCAAEKITIKKGTKEIRSNAFESCYNLTLIKLPKTVNKAENYAFGSYSSKLKVTYKGKTYKMDNQKNMDKLYNAINKK